MDGIERDWNYYDGLSRNEVVKLAMEEILDVKGLSKVKQILHKYNLSSVTFDYKLEVIFKRSNSYCPKKDRMGREKTSSK